MKVSKVKIDEGVVMIRLLVRKESRVKVARGDEPTRRSGLYMFPGDARARNVVKFVSAFTSDLLPKKPSNLIRPIGTKFSKTGGKDSSASEATTPLSASVRNDSPALMERFRRVYGQCEPNGSIA